MDDTNRNKQPQNIWSTEDQRPVTKFEKYTIIFLSILWTYVFWKFVISLLTLPVPTSLIP